MYLFDPNERELAKVLTRGNYGNLLAKIAEIAKQEIHIGIEWKNTGEETIYNLGLQKGKAEGIDIFLETLNSIANG